jgi:hypothetical protein
MKMEIKVDDRREKILIVGFCDNAVEHPACFIHREKKLWCVEKLKIQHWGLQLRAMMRKIKFYREGMKIF